MANIKPNKRKFIKNLDFFLKEGIQNYSSKRNFVFGPPHNNVSQLSPYINRRFISEEQIIKLITKDRSNIKVDEFITQLFWRTYFRGWLQLHPWVYEKHKNDNLKYNIPKKTGIKCFDNWTEELIETGYLHNHARMWYASIWIFTLKKSWSSGAYFFKNNLLDWCPASNTLGWRWVAGLHTINKHYLAKKDNINFFTNFKFNPQDEINEKALPIVNDLLNGEALSFSCNEDKLPNNLKNIGVVLNNNDLSLNLVLDDLNLQYDGCIFINLKKKIHTNNLIKSFEELIFNHIIEENRSFSVIENLADLFAWIKIKKIKNLIIPYETVGNNIFNKAIILEKLNSKGIKIIFYLRKWDNQAFPHANKGFFKFKKHIPNLLKLSGFR